MAVERERVFSGDKDRDEHDDEGILRPDEEILAQVREALRRHPELDAAAIEVEVNTGVVTLSGTVPDVLQKELASECAMNVDAVAEVFNYITVAPPPLVGAGGRRR